MFVFNVKINGSKVFKAIFLCMLIILLIILGIVILYYVIKSIIIYIKGKKRYFVNDMKEMINTEE